MELSYESVLGIVLGLCQWVKTKLTLTDNAAEIVTAIIGFILGSLYQYSITKPAEISGWLIVVFVGLAYWLVPSGLYKLVNSVASKIK